MADTYTPIADDRLVALASLAPLQPLDNQVINAARD
jgi:hypothetical protein